MCSSLNPSFILIKHSAEKVVQATIYLLGSTPIICTVVNRWIAKNSNISTRDYKIKWKKSCSCVVFLWNQLNKILRLWVVTTEHDEQNICSWVHPLNCHFALMHMPDNAGFRDLFTLGCATMFSTPLELRTVKRPTLACPF